MTDWADIPNFEITANSPVTALTDLKYRDRDDHLREVMAGTNVKKIPAQALELQASGSGQGLKVSAHNHILGSGTVAVASGASVTVDTGVPTANNRYPFATIAPVGAPPAAATEYDWNVRAKPGTNANWNIQIIRTADGGANQNVDWRLVNVAAA